MSSSVWFALYGSEGAKLFQAISEERTPKLSWELRKREHGKVGGIREGLPFMDFNTEKSLGEEATDEESGGGRSIICLGRKKASGKGKDSPTRISMIKHYMCVPKALHDSQFHDSPFIYLCVS